MTVDGWIIDADVHVTEAPDTWTGHLPSRFLDDAPRIVRTPDGVDVWHIGGVQQLAPVGGTAVAGWPDDFPGMPRNLDEVPPAAWRAPERLAYMDHIGVWACLLYPNVGGFGNEAFLTMADHDLRLACVRAYNDWLASWCDADPRRLLGVMATPFWDVDETVAEVRRCAELGHRAILFTGEPTRFGFPHLGDRHWDPLWSVAAELGLSVSFHIGGADFSSDFTPDRMAAHGLSPTLARATVHLFLGNAQQVVDLLFSGVLPRFPDTHFTTVESGAGWLPFVLESADYTSGYANIAAERPEFELAPSEYFARQVHACFLHEDIAASDLIQRVGDTNLMFETDYPHPVCLFGNVRQHLDRSMGGLPAETVGRLVWDNAAALYRVERPVLPWDRAGAESADPTPWTPQAPADRRPITAV